MPPKKRVVAPPAPVATSSSSKKKATANYNHGRQVRASERIAQNARKNENVASAANKQKPPVPTTHAPSLKAKAKSGAGGKRTTASLPKLDPKVVVEMVAQQVAGANVPPPPSAPRVTSITSTPRPPSKTRMVTSPGNGVASPARVVASASPCVTSPRVHKVPKPARVRGGPQETGILGQVSPQKKDDGPPLELTKEGKTKDSKAKSTNNAASPRIVIMDGKEYALVPLDETLAASDSSGRSFSPRDTETKIDHDCKKKGCGEEKKSLVPPMSSPDDFSGRSIMEHPFSHEKETTRKDHSEERTDPKKNEKASAAVIQLPGKIEESKEHVEKIADSGRTGEKIPPRGAVEQTTASEKAKGEREAVDPKDQKVADSKGIYADFEERYQKLLKERDIEMKIMQDNEEWKKQQVRSLEVQISEFRNQITLTNVDKMKKIYSGMLEQLADLNTGNLAGQDEIDIVGGKVRGVLIEFIASDADHAKSVCQSRPEDIVDYRVCERDGSTELDVLAECTNRSTAINFVLNKIPFNGTRIEAKFPVAVQPENADRLDILVHGVPPRLSKNVSFMRVLKGVDAEHIIQGRTILFSYKKKEDARIQGRLLQHVSVGGSLITITNA